MWDEQAEQCLGRQRMPSPVAPAQPEHQDLSAFVRDYVHRVLGSWAGLARVEMLQREIAQLKERCARIEASASLLVPIESLAPSTLKLIQPVKVVLRPVSDEFLATFFDASLSASGDTQVEAVSNLRELIADTYKMLSSLRPRQLGPGPRKQLEVLSTYIAP